MEPIASDSTPQDIADNRRHDRHILLLDDEPDITSVMTVALKSAGYSVDVFNDSTSAWSYLESRCNGSAEPAYKYDMIISDIRMPGLDGFEFVKRATALDRDVKILLISAYEIRKEEFDRFLPSLRIDALVNKPIRMSRLNDLVATLLRQEGHSGKIATDP